MSKSRVMIVTAGRNQASLILKARQMGLSVLATDRDENASSLSLADDSTIADAHDADALFRAASDFHAEAIVAEQTDVAITAVATVAERLGVPGIGREAAQRATDKYLMREACRQAGIATPEFRLVRSEAEALAAVREIGLPVVLKPTDGQSSRGVTKVTNIAAVPDAAAAALKASRSMRALVEECMIGLESSIESFVIGDEIHVLGVCEKIKCTPPYSFDLQLIYPAGFSPETMAAIEALNRAVIKAIGIRMGFAHAEMIITAAGVRLIEIAARGCGARIATDLLPALTDVDLLELRLRQSLGDPVEMPQLRKDRFGILRFFQLPSGTIRAIRGLDEAAALPGVLHVELAPTVGTRLTPPVSGDQRPGFMLAVAESRQGAIAIADKVTELVSVDVV
jgi:biotin carboxylase